MKHTDNSDVLKLALLHDIGKALTHEIVGPHAEIGAELVSNYEIDPKIVTTIR